MSEQWEHGLVRWPEDVAAEYRRLGVWRRVTVGGILRDTAGRYPDRAALAGAREHLSYRELDTVSDLLACGLLEAGLVPGDRVMVHLGNVPETVVAYYAMAKAGLIPVCTIAQHRHAEMSYLAAHTGARGWIAQADHPHDLVGLARRVAAEQESLEVLVTARGEADGFLSLDRLATGDAAAAHRDVAAVTPDPESVAVLQLSGGTTALPKVIPRLHTEYVYNSRALAEAWGWDERTVLMHPLPLMHNAGTVAAIQPVHLVGGTFVVGPSARPEDVLPLIQQERVTDLPVVPPAVLSRLLDSDHRAYDLTSVRRCVVAGEKLPRPLADRMEDELGWRCLQLFGMAEGLLMRTPEDAPGWIRKGTVGVPISPYDEVLVLDPEDRPVPSGALGQLCCRGPYTIRGYFDAAEHNRRAFTPDGFYRTGDLAREHRGPGGPFFSVEGRLKDVVNRGGEKINAEEVENVLDQHPAVRRAAVVAVPDAVLGERACACLVLRTGAEAPTVEDLRRLVLAHGLAAFKAPERVITVEELPLTNIGKVAKAALRVTVEERLRRSDQPSP